MQHADPHNAIFYILQTYNLLQQSMAIHMTVSEPKVGSFLYLFHYSLTLNSFHGKTDHWDS